MMKKVVLTLLLTSCYDAMDADQLERRVDYGTQLKALDRDYRQQSTIGTTPQNSCVDVSIDDSSAISIQKVRNDTKKLRALYNAFLDVFKTLKSYLEDPNHQEIRLLFDFHGNIPSFFERHLDNMNRYISESNNSGAIFTSPLYRLQLLNQTKEAIQAYATIAMHLNKNTSMAYRRVAVAEMGNNESGRIIKKLQLILMFGHKFVGLDFVIDNLMRRAHNIGRLAKQLELGSNAKTETFRSGISDQTDIESIKGMVHSIKSIQYNVKKMCETQLEDILNGSNVDKSANEFEQWMTQMEKCIHCIEHKVTELLLKIHKNPDKLHEHHDEIKHLLNLMTSCSKDANKCCATADIEVFFGVPPEEYNEQKWVVMAQRLMLNALSIELPNLALENSFTGKTSTSAYRCRSFKIDSPVRGKTEYKCTIQGKLGDLYDAHTVTVECEWAAVKAAIAHIIDHQSQVLVIQVYWEGSTPKMVFSAISRISRRDKLKEMVGILAHNLPTNVQVNPLWLGGAQIQFFSHEIDKGAIKQTLKIITEYLSTAKSPCFFDDIKEKPGLAQLFDKGVLVIRKEGINITPRFGTILIPNSDGHICWQYTTENVMSLYQAIHGRKIKRLNVKTHLEMQTRMFGRSAYYTVDEIDGMACLHTWTEQPNPQNVGHLVYSSIGMAFRLESINEMFYEELNEFTNSRCDIQLLRDGNNQTVCVGLLMTNFFVNSEFHDIDVKVGLTSHKMMKALLEMFEKDAAADSRLTSHEADYIPNIKIKDAVVTIRQIKDGPTYVQTENRFRRRKSSENCMETEC